MSQTDTETDADEGADWRRRVVGRSLRSATQRSIDRGEALIRAAGTVLERSGGEDITVQDVADEAGQSLRTLYQYFESKDDLLLAVFEESMRTYAKLVARAIEGLDDPLERLGGALIAASSMSEFSERGLDRGLARLRLRLAESSPELVGRSQEAVTTLIRELIAEAATVDRIHVDDTDSAAFLLLSLNAAFITSERLGNDSGVPRPDVPGVVVFCLRGLGAEVDGAWVEAVTARLRLPTRGAPRRRTKAGSGGSKPKPKGQVSG